MCDQQSSSLAVASLSFSALQSQTRTDAVCPSSIQPSSRSGHRIPATAVSFGPRDRRRHLNSVKGFFLTQHQQAKRWLSGIGVGNGGPIFVRSLVSRPPFFAHGLNIPLYTCVWSIVDVSADRASVLDRSTYAVSSASYFLRLRASKASVLSCSRLQDVYAAAISDQACTNAGK